MQPYEQHIQLAATFTLKQKAKISVKRFDNYGDERYEFWMPLTDDALNSTIQYFLANLKWELYGNSSKHKNKQSYAQPLVIVALEGRNGQTRRHLHMAIGNIPTDKIEFAKDIVLSTWGKCDFAYRKNEVKKVTHAGGWLGYLTKEVGYTDNDALDIVESSIPPFIQQASAQKVVC